MDYFRYYDQNKFMKLVPKIKSKLAEWRILEVSLTGKTTHNTAFIARKLQEYFAGKDGAIFICNQMEILAFVHLGPEPPLNKLSQDITDKMPKYSCTAEETDMTAEGILRVQLRLQDLEEVQRKKESASPLLADRKRRKERVVLVVDDDMFMRSLITKHFQGRAQVVELPSAEGVVAACLEHLPDIIFLDIHLPGGSGIDILAEILNFDETAYVVMLSSDSVKDNVLGAQKHGAKSFIAKPFTKEKLDACFAKALAAAGLPGGEGAE